MNYEMLCIIISKSRDELPSKNCPSADDKMIPNCNGPGLRLKFKSSYKRITLVQNKCFATEGTEQQFLVWEEVPSNKGPVSF